jgi:hypothetical protein
LVCPDDVLALEDSFAFPGVPSVKMGEAGIEVSVEEGLYTWADAQALCASKPGSLTSVEPWRLGTAHEIIGLTDMAAEGLPSPYPPSGDDAPAMFWTITLSANGLPIALNTAWKEFFEAEPDEPMMVICFQDERLQPSTPPIEGRVVHLVDGTTLDRATGLDWSAPSPAGMPWRTALTTCRDRGQGWRVPSLKELLSVADFGSPARCPVIASSDDAD